MMAVPERIKVAMAMIERAANAGDECPTNSVLAAAMGASSMSDGSEAVSTLEAMGLISVVRGRAQRVITISATGRSTAGEVKTPIGTVPRSVRPQWTGAKDNVLMEAISQGLDFEQAAHWVGLDAEQCAARFDELAARFGRQAA